MERRIIRNGDKGNMKKEEIYKLTTGQIGAIAVIENVLEEFDALAALEVVEAVKIRIEGENESL